MTGHPGPAAVAGSLVGWLRDVKACRVLEIPRAPVVGRDRAGPPRGQRQRHASLVAAYHGAVGDGGERVLTGWRRPCADGPIDLVVAGPVIGRPAGGGGQERTMLLSLPPGGRGRPLARGQLLADLAAIPHWTRLVGVADGLLGSGGQSERDDERPCLEDCLLRIWHEPFAWVLIAEPVPPEEVTALASRAAGEQRDAQSRATSSPEYALRAERAKKRHLELREADATGLWRVHLLAGAETAAGARSVAGLVAASADLQELPYALVPTGPDGDLLSTLEGSAKAGVGESPFLASSVLVSAVAGVPREEVPGVRLVLRPEFDVTPETSRSAGLVLGRVLDRNGVGSGDLTVSHDSVNRHTFVCGATGAGKSQTVRHLLEEATAAGVPWLVVEPAKAEYALMANRIGDGKVVRIRPGDPGALPAGLNPLEPAPGFALQTHLDLVRALFTAAFQGDEPFPQVLSAALTRCYEDLGWNLALNRARHPGVHPRYPTLTDLQRTAERVVDEIGYGKEVTDNVRGFIRVRISSLRLGTPGRFFEGGHPIDFGALMRCNVVFEIDDVGDDRDKAFLMGTVLIRLAEHLRVQKRTEGPKGAEGLRHLSVFEEAHRLLRRTEVDGPAAHSVEMFTALLAEIRAYGEGLVIAEQIPSKLAPDVIKNTAVKIVHRLPAQDDRDAVGATMNLTEAQSQYVVTLRPGMAAVFTDGMDFPVLVQMPDGTAREKAEPVLAPLQAVIGRNHGACSPECARWPCLAAEIDGARQFLGDEPRVVVWGELAVLAHLVGVPLPVPVADDFLDVLTVVDARLRDGAIRLAVEDAVAARSTALASTHSPEAFAHHVAEDLRAYFDGRTACGSEPWPWLATPYKWSPVIRALQATEGTAAAAGRHPDSARWEEAYGGPVPGASCDEQLRYVNKLTNRARRNRSVLEGVLFGSASASALENAVGAGRADDSWVEELGSAEASFHLYRQWPTAFLALS